MNYYTERDIHVRDKVKAVLHSTNYATKKEYEHTAGANTSDLVAKKDFVTLKAEVDKLDINKLVNVPTSLNNLKTKVDDLDVGKLKVVLVDMKKLSDEVDKQFDRNTKFNTINTKLTTSDYHKFMHI